MLAHDTYQTPIGTLHLAAHNNALVGAWYHTAPKSTVPLDTTQHSTPLIKEAKQQLEAYFRGTLKIFTLPLDSCAGTPFQQQCWKALAEIPYGKTWSYKQQADFIGKPKAVRAVGSANGKNPFSIILPCHRVIGSNHSLTGYAGGLDKKRFLLQHEQAIAA